MAAPHPIRIFGDPVLRTTCAPVGEIDDGVRKLIDDMIATMYAAPGVGLAANQVGVQKRLFVYDDGEGLGARTLINPEITHTSGYFTWDEGCLSVPGLFFSVVRPDVVHIKGQDGEGNDVEMSADGFLGRILQHEVDHLNGMLFIERLDPDQRKIALRAMRERSMQSNA